MIYTLDEARDILHLDGEDNDEQILALLDAIPPYLTATTGYESVTGDYSPVARAAARFILWQWYYGENADTDKVQRVIDSLLKALSAERKQPHDTASFGGVDAPCAGVPMLKALYLRTMRTACRNRPSCTLSER